MSSEAFSGDRVAEAISTMPVRELDTANGIDPADRQVAAQHAG